MRYLLLSMIMFASFCNKMNEPEFPPPHQLEEVFSDNTYQLTGVAVSRQGRTFTNYPLWSDIYKYAVVEIKNDTTSTPYPDAAMNGGSLKADQWVCVQAVHVDDSNRLWVVDPASPKMQGVVNNAQKLVLMDMDGNTVRRVYPLAGVTDSKSYINDVRVDVQRGFAYLTNSSQGGIVVVDIRSGAARQVLKATPSTLSDPAYTLTIDGKVVMKNGKPVKMHSDGIALTPDGDWLYYKPLTDDRLFRIRTEYLRDSTLDDQALEAKVEMLGHFTTTDGMAFDKKGNLYLGDLERYRIIRIDPQLRVTPLITDKRLIWPDSYQVTDEGYLYVSVSQIHKQPEYNNGVNLRTIPYKIYRMRLPGF